MGGEPWLATDWGSVSSTASPSAVETVLEVFLKRRQWEIVMESRKTYTKSCRATVGMPCGNRVHGERLRIWLFFTLCAVCRASALFRFCLFFFRSFDFVLDKGGDSRTFHQVPQILFQARGFDDQDPTFAVRIRVDEA
jgi:hypothetical protein